MSDAARRRADLPTVRPGAAGPVCEPDLLTGRCATCADEAVEGRVLAHGEDGLAQVELDGTIRAVALDLVEDVRVGDRVLVHAGVALAKVNR